MRFIQHIPDVYIRLQLAARGIKPVEFDFHSLRDFLNNDFIRRITSDINFYRFTICRYKNYELISELKNGKTFKIGELDGNISEIPEWVRKEDGGYIN